MRTHWENIWYKKTGQEPTKTANTEKPIELKPKSKIPIRCGHIQPNSSKDLNNKQKEKKIPNELIQKETHEAEQDPVTKTHQEIKETTGYGVLLKWKLPFQNWLAVDAFCHRESLFGRSCGRISSPLGRVALGFWDRTTYSHLFTLIQIEKISKSQE